MAKASDDQYDPIPEHGPPPVVTNTRRAGETDEQAAMRERRVPRRPDPATYEEQFDPLPDHGNQFGPPPEASAPRRYLGLLSSEDRKKHPMATGLLDYFPDALAMVAHISWKGNEKHNPGQPLHWARSKSTDQPDCMVRHLVERYELDEVQAEHSASLVWRALADLQLHMEKKYNLDPPRAAKD